MNELVDVFVAGTRLAVVVIFVFSEIITGFTGCRKTEKHTTLNFYRLSTLAVRIETSIFRVCFVVVFVSPCFTVEQ